VKACRGLARSCPLDDASDIWEAGQHLDGGPSINQQSKEVQVGPGKQTSVVGFLRKMGRTLSVLECRVLVSTPPTHDRKRRLSLCADARGRGCLSIELCETLRLVQLTR
jgi:hypothetical protein